MRFLAITIAVVVLAAPAAIALPATHLTLPTSDAGMAGAAADVAGLKVRTGLVVVPGVTAQNPLADAGLGPAQVSSADASVRLRTSEGGLRGDVSEASVLAPLPLLPDDALYVGAGTFSSADGLGESFGDAILVLQRHATATGTGTHRASTAAPPSLRADGAASPFGAPTLEHDDVAPAAPRAERDQSGATGGETRTQVSSPVTRPLVSPTTAAVAAGVGFGVLAVLGAALYHRIRPNATLDNDTRKRIFEAVIESPGVGVQEVAKASGVSYSTATYHLERLIEAGMVVMTPDGNKLCYYKNGGAFTEHERRILPILKNQEAARVLEAIVQAPGTYRTVLAERLGVTTTTINWHLRRLREAGLVDENRQGRSAYLFLSPAGRGSLASLASKLAGQDADACEVALRCSGAAATTSMSSSSMSGAS